MAAVAHSSLFSGGEFLEIVGAAPRSQMGAYLNQSRKHLLAAQLTEFDGRLPHIGARYGCRFTRIDRIRRLSELILSKN